ncbi:uncharacterized protein EI97DRAFT_239028 [Westerdykella ornata]|uniref:Uncharacterized protein n=1 Tax=Westerdykella ornata TaxID=318751 RepID=A0A6A6J7K8_WESOR|nr:uncharacterized protein EI97DRAFT_239028 [Westerdykella ornata]KAF2271988.1 hypothetical protein EI97DRAFT_239028 [Westerdykella ornata]
MSLARAVTKRIKRSDASSSPAESVPTTPTRAQSMRTPGQQIDRNKISSPVALISTTNMLSYNAPDIATLRQASSPSTPSAEDSDHSTTTARSRSSSTRSRETLTDASSLSPDSPRSPAPNQLSGFFPSGNKLPRRSASSSNLPHSNSAVSGETCPVPAIPERALSHSKRAHERLAQKRSLQSMTPSTRGSLLSNRSSREQRSSIDIFRSPAVIQEEREEAHPFGPELEQLNEIAEEFGGVVRDAEYEADLKVIRERGLARLCADEYLAEIRPLFSRRFGYGMGTHVAAPGPMAWI